MKFLRTLLAAYAVLATSFLPNVFAQSCSGNLLSDATGYYGGFEAGNQSIANGRGFTDMEVGSHHGAYQIVSGAINSWHDISGGGYLPVAPHAGNFMMLIHTSSARLWYKSVAVIPGQIMQFSAWIASAKEKPVSGFEVRLRVKYGTTTTVIASSVAQQGRWSEITGFFTVPAGVTTIELQVVDPYPDTNVSNFLLLDDVCIRGAVQLNPDINATYVNETVIGNVSTNDRITPGVAYGTPVAVAGNPPGATISLSSKGTYSFKAATTPGVYVYTVPVCVTSQATNCYTSLLTITVLQKNSISNMPVANTDFGETKMKKAVLLNTLANDAAGYIGGILNPASVVITEAPKRGTASVNLNTGTITYTPLNDFVGNDTLRYRVCDNSPGGLCATAQQIITVKAGGEANSTSAADDYAATSINTPVSGNVKTNDTDVEGHTQTVAAQYATVAGKGTLLLSANGNFTFTPAANYVGPVSFIYTTCDNGTPQACANATLYLLVQSFTSLTLLPVNMLSFSGKVENEAVRLQWETASENNSSHFVVEHSVNGAQWQAIGSVKAVINSTSTSIYSFVHASPGKGTNYYRLQQVDATGSTTASKVVTVKTGGGIASLKNIYPNPFSSSVQLAVQADAATTVRVQLFDINGKMAQQAEKFVPAGESMLTIDRLEGLPSGTYMVKVAIGNTTLTQKIFKR